MRPICFPCSQTLLSADGTDPARFCIYCGKPLGTTNGATGAGEPSDNSTIPWTPTRLAATQQPLAETVVPHLECDSAQPPEFVGGYRLIKLLGKGGMGAVYMAEAPNDRHDKVAVKLISPRLATDPVHVERFRLEGQLASQLHSPCCVFVLAADIEKGWPYIVMELMPGETLKDLVETEGPLSPERAVTYILDVIEGLHEAHRRGIIHRDMKPSNCFLTHDRCRVKVGDFGLSKSLTGPSDHHLTGAGVFLGTILFASPEQFLGEPLDYTSDIYSVCATLYYLLCGAAPHQHENPQMVISRRCTEDPPPLRSKRPDIPRSLEAIVLKGLQRDRGRRWQTLDDLRDALTDLLPDRHHPARPRALLAAYVLDRILLAFVSTPLEIGWDWLVVPLVPGNGVGSETIHVLMLLGYFTLGEGLWGTTVGKWLLRLRVSRVGRTGPPGLLRAFVRSAVFLALLSGLFVVPEACWQAWGPTTGILVGGLVFLASAVGLSVQLWRGGGFRGLHDRASGCHVVQRPFPTRRLRLRIPDSTPLEPPLPQPEVPLPRVVGRLYQVRGRLAAELPAGEQLWLGHDEVLRRNAVLWLWPADSARSLPPAPTRPTRLRRLGNGSIEWSNTNYKWVAYAAPQSGPLLEVVDPRRPLRWADARPLLEQLTDELLKAQTEGNLPTPLSLRQVWVEPAGRLQLLDFPLSRASHPPAPTPFHLLREVASLVLEGRPRSSPGPVRAPLPAHAVPVLDRLFTSNGYTKLDEFHRDLKNPQSHPLAVTSSERAGQLGLLAVLLALPLGLLFMVTFLLAPLLALDAARQADYADAALAAVTDPETRQKLAKNPQLAKPLQHPRLVARLEEFADRQRAEAARRRELLLAPQRLVLDSIEAHAPPDPDRQAGFSEQVADLVRWAGAADGTPRSKRPGPWRSEAGPILVALAAVPVGMILLSALLRGGVSLPLAGLFLVRSDGRPATRGQCLIRAALVWMPLAGALFGAAVLQAYVPERVYLALGLWLTAVGLLPLYVVLALRFPDRGPHDRLAGTYLVPA